MALSAELFTQTVFIIILFTPNWDSLACFLNQPQPRQSSATCRLLKQTLQGILNFRTQKPETPFLEAQTCGLPCPVGQWVPSWHIVCPTHGDHSLSTTPGYILQEPPMCLAVGQMQEERTDIYGESSLCLGAPRLAFVWSLTPQVLA